MSVLKFDPCEEFPLTSQTSFHPFPAGASIPLSAHTPLLMSAEASVPANATEDLTGKVFVGNLSYSTRESELKDIFTKVGKV
jgi:RNA recognition motif-containing protein